MAQINDVFISYSRKDKAFVHTLHEALTLADRKVWVDWKDIPLTADWWAEIQEGIEGADSFVFVISPDSVSSKVCTQELEHALQHNKRLFPVLYREAKNVPQTVGKLNWIFFREADDFDESFEKLIAVMDLDLEWVKAHTRLIQRAMEWEKKEHDPSYLLRGTDLANAENYLSRPDLQPALTQLQRDYILASQQQNAAQLQRELAQAQELARSERRRLEEQQHYTTRLQRRAMVIIGALALVIVLGVFALVTFIQNGTLVLGTEEIVETMISFADAEANSDMCWAGSLSGLVDHVMPACEQAIAIDSEVAYFYESRGLARALTGNTPGAISDFREAVALATETGVGEDSIYMWEDWIGQLENGGDPFSQDMLDELRADWEAEKEYFMIEEGFEQPAPED